MQYVIWADEKIFVLNQRPNRKNDGVWSKVISRQIVETNDRNGKKVMMFVAIVDGQIPILHAFVDENCSNQSVNGASYLKLLQDVVWPADTGGSKMEPPPSLHNFGQGVPSQKVQWSGDQSRNPNLMASAFP